MIRYHWIKRYTDRANDWYILIDTGSGRSVAAIRKDPYRSGYDIYPSPNSCISRYYYHGDLDAAMISCARSAGIGDEEVETYTEL